MKRLTKGSKLVLFRHSLRPTSSPSAAVSTAGSNASHCNGCQATRISAFSIFVYIHIFWIERADEHLIFSVGSRNTNLSVEAKLVPRISPCLLIHMDILKCKWESHDLSGKSVGLPYTLAAHAGCHFLSLTCRGALYPLCVRAGVYKGWSYILTSLATLLELGGLCRTSEKGVVSFWGHQPRASQHTALVRAISRDSNSFCSVLYGERLLTSVASFKSPFEW